MLSKVIDCFTKLAEKYDFLDCLVDEITSRATIYFKDHKGFRVIGYCLRFLLITNTVAYGGKVVYVGKDYIDEQDYLKFTEDITLKDKNVNFDYLEKLILKTKTQIEKLILKRQLDELEQEFKEN